MFVFSSIFKWGSVVFRWVGQLLYKVLVVVVYCLMVTGIKWVGGSAMKKNFKPVIAIFADHLLVPSNTLCLTAFMWPEWLLSSTPNTALNTCGEYSSGDICE